MKKSKLPIRVYVRLNMIMKTYSLVCRQVLIVGIFDLIEQTYQDILKKAGQELIEEDDENVS